MSLGYHGSNMTSQEIFRKYTYTDQYLNIDSNHTLEHKGGAVCTLVESVGSGVEDHRMENIRNALHLNCYPDMVLKGMDREVPREQCTERTINVTDSILITTRQNNVEWSRRNYQVILYLK